MQFENGQQMEGYGSPTAFPPPASLRQTTSESAWREAFELFDDLLELPETQSRLDFIERQPDSNLRAILTELLRNASSDSALLREETFSRAIRSGARIGRYELGRTLGRGGSGRVYAAVDMELGRTVAVKFLAASSLKDQRAVERLVREAQTASALNHPGIVTIYEVVRHAGEIGLAMELVEGQPLSEFRGAPVPTATVIRWGRQIAQALSAAHAKGIVHRDIKPENVVLRPDGYLKVLDFGLAQVHEYTPESLFPAQPGQNWHVAGTPRYMAPEQARGEPAQPPSDLFSTGILLWELASGLHPFPDPSPLRTAQAIAQREPQSFPRGAGAPPALVDLLHALLCKDPAARPSAVELDQRLAIIERAIASRHETAEPAAGRKPVLGLILALLLVAAALGTAHWLAIRTDALPPIRESNQPPLSLISLPFLPESGVQAAVLSPGGERLAYLPTGGDLTIQSMSSRAEIKLATPNALTASRIVWFADERRLLVSGTQGPDGEPLVWLFDADPTNPNEAPSPLARGVRDAVPSPDGSRIAFVSADRTTIFVAHTDGAHRRAIRTSGEGATFSSLVWTADSWRLAALHLGARASAIIDPPQSFQIMDAKTGQLTANVPDLGIISPTALPDGRILALPWAFPWESHGGALLDIRTDPRTGDVVDITRHKMNYAHDALYSNFSASRDGARMILVAAEANANLHLASLSGARGAPTVTKVEALSVGYFEEYPHAWSHDGNTIYFESNEYRNTYGLHRLRLDRRVAEPLHLPPTSAVVPHLTPDGRWLLFLQKFPRAHDDPRKFDLMRLPLNNTGTPGSPELVLETANSPEEFRCGLLPDSRCVIRSVEDDHFVYRELDPLRGRGAVLARVPANPSLKFDWDLSPDGTTVASPNHDPLSAELRLVDLRTSSERTVPLPGLSALGAVAWSADGQGIFVTCAFGSGGLLAYADLQGNWRKLLNTRRRTYVVPSPDGKHLVFPDRRRAGAVKVLHWP